jgi:hypothetical protein
VLIIIVFTVSVTALWFVYYHAVSRYVGRISEEATILTKSNLLTDLSDEYTRLNAAVSVIGGSIATQEFLVETDVSTYYDRAAAVSEIIRSSVYPSMTGDTIYTVSASGALYRFAGSVSSDAMEGIYQDLLGRINVYTVVTIGGTDWFCLTSPVYPRAAVSGDPVGHIVILSNLASARRALTKLDVMTGIDTAVIVDSTILFSSNPELDGQSIETLDRLYGAVTVERVAGSSIYAAAAITNEAMNYARRLSQLVFLVAIGILLGTSVLMYKLLSAKMVNPLLQSTDNLHMGLLKTQIDAHFVVNTITCIEGLAHQGKTEKIVTVAQNLAYMLKERYKSDDEINVFEQMEDAERYIEIMNIRSDDKFQVVMDVDDELFRCRMLVQIIQPIVENALTHGLGNKKSDCRLTVSGRLKTDCVLFEISDNGAGMELAPLLALQARLDDGREWNDVEYRLRGVGLTNIQRRVQARYGKQYGLSISGEAEKGLTVTIRLPIVTGDCITKQNSRG